jgi:hypothetical protein
MSFLTATNTELIYSMPVAGSDMATATAATTVTANTASNPAAYLPPLYSIWQPSSIVGKGFRVVLRGTYDSTAVTKTFSYGLNTTQGTAAPQAVVLAATGAFTAISSTSGCWEAEFDVTVNSTGEPLGTNTGLNLQVAGTLTFGPGGSPTASSAAYMLGASNATGTPALVAVSPVQAYWWEASFASGSAGVHLNCTQHLIFGLN